MSEQQGKKISHTGPMSGGPMGKGSMGQVVEKPKNFNTTMTKLLAYCKQYLPAIFFALAAAAAGTILQIIGPDQLKNLTNEIMKGLPAMVNGAPVLGTIDMNAV